MRPRLLSKALRKLTVSGLLALGLLLSGAASAGAQSITVYFPHFAYGSQPNGSWTTTDYYTNGTGAPNVSGMLQLFAPGGTQNLAACEVDFTNGTVLHLSPCSNIPIALSQNPLSSLGLKIKGEAGVQLQSGWSQITFNAPVSSSRQFAFSSDGSNSCCPQNNPYTEVAVLPSGPAQFFGATVVPNSGVAFANPGFFGLTGSITIQGSVFDTSGNLVAQNSVSLGLNQQTAKLVGGAGGFFPTLPSSFKVGTALFTSDQAFIATGFNFEGNNGVGVDIPAATGPKAALTYAGTFTGANGGQSGTFSTTILPSGNGRFSCVVTSTPPGGATTTRACAGSTLVNQKGDVTFHIVETDPTSQGGGSYTGGFSADRTTIQGILMSGPGGGFSFNGTFMATAVGPITW